jgi:TRAP-type uncharacterized transport system fused permease subunit
MYSVRIASVAYILPFLILFSPAMVLELNDWLSFVMDITTALLITLSMVMVVENHWIRPLRPWERVLAMLNFAMLIYIFMLKAYWMLIIGFLFFAWIALYQSTGKKASWRIHHPGRGKNP